MAEPAPKTAEQYNLDVAELIRATESFLVTVPWSTETGKLRTAIQTVRDWDEHGEDPQRDGWVDSQGRP